MTGFVAEHRRRSNAKLLRRIVIKKGDITKQTGVDAIVSVIQANLDVSGSINQALIKAAGNDFDTFILDNIYKPKPGDVYVVPGFDLPVKNVIFVVTPNWKDEFDREDVHLLRCYRLSMKMAESMKIRRIAYPALATGGYGFPLERAARLAIRGIMERMTENFTEVRIICDNDKKFDAFTGRLKKFAAEISKFS